MNFTNALTPIRQVVRPDENIRIIPMKLRFYEKTIYGRIMIYPDTGIMQAMKTITGKLTIDESQIRALAALGLDVTIDRLPC